MFTFYQMVRLNYINSQQVESSDVFIPTTEASKPVYNFVTDV